MCRERSSARQRPHVEDPPGSRVKVKLLSTGWRIVQTIARVNYTRSLRIVPARKLTCAPVQNEEDIRVGSLWAFATKIPAPALALAFPFHSILPADAVEARQLRHIGHWYHLDDSGVKSATCAAQAWNCIYSYCWASILFTCLCKLTHLKEAIETHAGKVILPQRRGILSAVGGFAKA